MECQILKSKVYWRIYIDGNVLVVVSAKWSIYIRELHVAILST